MLENDFDYIGWIEKAVEDNYIPNFDHTKFINKEEIGSRIIKANLSETDTILVVKSGGLKEIVNELRIQKEVDFHANILRFCGISKPDNQYSLILEYADDGTLYSYLKKNFTKLEWDDKYRLALQLASAVECIHNKGIIHCDLHAHNVNLYTACWASDPNERPSIQQVVSDLKSIENNEAIYSTKCTTKNEIKKEPPNKDIDYVMDNDHSNLFIDDDFPNSKIDDDVDLNTNDFIQNNLVLNLTDLTDNVERIIDQLIDHLMRMHDEMDF
ncbi:unnamed protein product [Rhizophagus irregularis]|nr:unnamed protein product [Rhizophagus irregularis]